MIIAIVVGISKYQNSEFEDLPGAKADALLFVQSLCNWGVEKQNIHLFLDVKDLGEILTDCFQNLRKISEPFKLIFYYCGHGYRTPSPDPKSYLLFNQSAVSLDALLNEICSLNANEYYLFMDACHLRINSLTHPTLENELQNQRSQSKSLFCLLSSGIDKSYEDAQKGYGYFTHALIKALSEIKVGDNTPTVLFKKICGDLEKEGLALPEMYNIGTSHIDFFSKQQNVSLLDLPIEVFKDINQEDFKRGIGAIAACGKYLNKELFCSIHNLEPELLTHLENTGLVIHSQSGWIPHECLFAMAESENLPIDPNKTLNYWISQMDEVPNELQASECFVLSLKCFGYQKKFDGQLLKAFKILKSKFNENDFLQQQCMEIFIFHGAISKAGLFLAEIFYEINEVEKAKILRSLPRFKISKSIWLFTSIFSILLFLGIIFYSTHLSDEKFISIPSKYPNFVGRKEILQTLHKALIPSPNSGVPTIALYGEGGIGKSETAITFANDHINDFSLIYWVDLGSEEAYKQSYYALAEHFHIPTGSLSFEKVKRRIDFILENNKFYKPWLLIYDNGDYPIELPKTGNGRILITTRNKELWKSAVGIPVPLFPESTAKELFYKVLGKEESLQEWDKLSKNLNYFPVALDQVLHYLKASPNLNLESYNGFLEQSRLEVLKYNSSDDRYLLSWVTMWNLNLRELQLKSPKAYEWLQICSFLYPDKIPMKWLDIWLEQQGFAEGIVQFEANEILRILANHGYICFDKKNKTFSIHRLKQQLMHEGKDGLSWANNTLTFLAQQVSHIEHYDQLEDIDPFYNIFSDWENSTAWVLEKMGNTVSDSETLAALLNVLGHCKTVKGEYKQGQELYQRALAVQEKIYPNRLNEKIILTLTNLGFSYFRLGQYEKAEEVWMDALKLAESIYRDTPSPHLAHCLSKLVLLFQWKGDPRALEYCERGLAIQKAYYGSKINSEICESFKWLGAIHCNAGNFAKAFKYTLEALEMNKFISTGKINIAHCYILGNLGILYTEIGDIDRALECHLEVLKIYEKTDYKIGVPLIILECVSHEYILKKDFKKAFLYLNKANKVIDELYADHFDLTCLSIMTSFGDLYIETKNPKKAINYYNNSLEKSKLIINKKNHSFYYKSYRGLGKAHLALGEVEKGIQFLEDALTVLRSHYPEHHFKLFPILNELGQAYQKLDPSKSEQYFLWAKEAQKTKLL